MQGQFIQWLHGFLPQPLAAGRSERARAAIGACIGLFVTALLTHVLAPGVAAYLIAPMGASAVLLFCVPASPLAHPWSVVGGNTLSALVGAACVHLVPDPLLAAPLAGCLAIAAMFALRCLHPPGGAVALTTVLGGAAVHEAGFLFAFEPVALNSALIVGAAILYNNLTRRRRRAWGSPSRTWKRRWRATARCLTSAATTCWPSSTMPASWRCTAASASAPAAS
jgi:CBS domain-containing membrane protein